MNTCFESIILCCTDCFKYLDSDTDNDSNDIVEITPLNKNINAIPEPENISYPSDNFIINIESPKDPSPKNKIKIITDYVDSGIKPPIYFKKIESLQLEPINNDFVITISPNNKWAEDFEFIEKND